MYLYIFTIRENELDGLYLIDLWKQLIVIIKISENTIIFKRNATDRLLLFKLKRARCDNRNRNNIRNIILHKMMRRKLNGEAPKIFFIYDQTRVAFLCVLLLMFTSNLTWNWCIFNIHVHI